MEQTIDPVLVRNVAEAIAEQRIDPAIFSAAIAGLVSIFVASISAFAVFQTQVRRLRRELQLEFAIETALQMFLRIEKWPQRSFGDLERRFKGLAPDELRTHLIRCGAVTFKGEENKELWGLVERNSKKLSPENSE